MLYQRKQISAPVLYKFVDWRTMFATINSCDLGRGSFDEYLQGPSLPNFIWSRMTAFQNWRTGQSDPDPQYPDTRLRRKLPLTESFLAPKDL
jgi:hypothetical protein